jgi:cyclic pyranopterin phosphate synthase
MGRQGMVDISGKQPTRRVAVAEAVLVADEQTVRAIEANELPKADPLATARAAALLAVKNTPGTIPHCHPIPLTGVEVEFAPEADRVRIRCRVATEARTGAEMEALCGVSVAALTLYDMMKAVCRGARIECTRLLEKSGGRSGHWRADAEAADA